MPGRLGAALLFLAALAGAQTPTAPKPPTYVGSEACQVCHEDIAKAFAKNPHSVLEPNAAKPSVVKNARKRGWEDHGCESCHGPGSAHVESTAAADIRNPLHMPPAEVDQLCLTCHRNQPTHVGRIQSGHAGNQVSCVACHSMHKSREALKPETPTTINAACASCHTAVWASFQRPHKHKLPEGAMSCVDCHNPHGSFLGRSMQTVSANEPGCFKCHGDKRGPFTFEHAPVRLEGCAGCHEPHGSANPRMLNQHEVFLTCLQCHANTPRSSVANGTIGGVPPAFHDLRSPRFQNCTVCHTKVHGSNVNAELLR